MAIKKSQLYSSIWQACDELRGGMDASEYKDYVLVLLFVRYVSDKYAGKKDELVVVPAGGSFADLVKLKGKTNIGEGINKVLSALAEANGLKGVIDAVDFNDEDKLGKGKEMQDRLSNLVAIFENSELDFSKNKAEGDDLLGDAYEYLMKHFAVESGKSKGQFYTPAEVSRIIAKVIGAKDAKGKTHTVYDPTCGSGSLLLKVASETPKGIAIFGQEKENATATLAILNMWLHGEPTAEIKKGQSTLSNPLFVDQHGVLKTFDYVVANPPFSYKAWRNGFNPEEDPHNRFEGFGIPPKKNGDFAFLLHIVKSLKSTGKGAVILPHGVLFRGNTEADIRKALIQRGYIKGVIGLPANLFYGTGIPACIIVIDKEDAAKRTGIFMIDASKGFIKDGNKNRLREQDIRKAVDVWNEQLETSKYSRFVPNDEIKKNEYNLNIPRYIDTQEPEDIQDIEAHLKGGIPNADIDALDEYWKVCPSLKKALFKSSRSGYSALAIIPDEVRKTIFSHSEFNAFREKIVEAFTSWRKANVLKLKDIDKNDHPKAIIQEISDDILKAFQDAHLLDKYDIYQCLMSYWEEVMQDDAHIITADGWEAGNEVIRLPKESKGKKKDIEGLGGLEGRLMPVSLLIRTYFTKDQTQIDELSVKLEQIASQMDELKDEHGSEDGPLSEVIENDKIKKGDVQKRIKEIKGDADYADELKVLEQYASLFEAEAETKKRIKETEQDLEKKVIAKYPTLALKEIKSIVVESKWMNELQARVIGEVDRLSQRLAGRVKNLGERYSKTLAQIQDELSSLTIKVAKSLEQMSCALQDLLSGKKRISGFSKEWRLKTLGELCNYQNGTALEKYFNSIGGYKVISIGNYSTDGKYIDNETFISREFYSSVKKYVLNKNDLTMILNDKTSTGGIIGRVLLVDRDDEYVFNQRTMRLISKSEVSPKFLFYKINCDEVHSKIVALSKPGTQIYINTNDVIGTEIFIPETIEEQNAIVAILDDMNAQTDILEQKLNKHKMLKQSMMQVLLTGRIRLI